MGKKETSVGGKKFIHKKGYIDKGLLYKGQVYPLFSDKQTGKSWNLLNSIKSQFLLQKLDTNLLPLDYDRVVRATVFGPDGKEIFIKPKKSDQNTKRLWGMNRSLINNAVIGSSKGYEKILELVGVGYRAALKGNKLNLQLGYSHEIDFDIPEGIKIMVEKQTTLKITGSNKQQVGSITSKLKTLRKIEPYKGKGIREKGQYVLKKEGKKK